MSAPLGPFRSFRLPGEDITWAGECLWTGNLCLGTESGKLVFFQGEESEYKTIEREVSEEAVNEVAFWQDIIGVSTRNEVLFFRGPHPDPGLSLIARSPNGSHGITVTPRGRFLAPMGTEGILCFDSFSRNAWFDRPANGLRNYYRVAYVGECNGKEILACATRLDGLARIQLDAARASRVVTLTAASVDLIDACPLQCDEWPFAVAGLSLDRSIVFVRDLLALDRTDPRRLRFDQVRGTPYCLLYAQGSIVLLTSEELVIFPDLASRFLRGEPFSKPVPAHHSSIQAVEAYVMSDRDLVVITDDGVRVSELCPTAACGVVESPSRGNLSITDWSDTQDLLLAVATDWVPLVA
jgi:uncharacterized metal-binding protein